MLRTIVPTVKTVPWPNTELRTSKQFLAWDCNPRVEPLVTLLLGPATLPEKRQKKFSLVNLYPSSSLRGKETRQGCSQSVVRRILLPSFLAIRLTRLASSLRRKRHRSGTYRPLLLIFPRPPDLSTKWPELGWKWRAPSGCDSTTAGDILIFTDSKYFFFQRIFTHSKRTKTKVIAILQNMVKL